jgi:hypothetical protein
LDLVAAAVTLAPVQPFQNLVVEYPSQVANLGAPVGATLHAANEELV